jgi:thioredoxin-dependent peroxiredoxin
LKDTRFRSEPGDDEEEGVDMTIVMAAALASAVAPGAKAPAFSLESSTGKKVALSDYKGQTLVLAFFPKAFTGG